MSWSLKLQANYERFHKFVTGATENMQREICQECHWSLLFKIPTTQLLAMQKKANPCVVGASDTDNGTYAL